MSDQLTYIYKLIPASSSPSSSPSPSSLPSPLPKILPLSALDTSSGFIHLSTSLQIPNTLKHFFQSSTTVHILRIPYARVEKDVRWEDPKAEVCGPRAGEGMFPHLYNGGVLGIDQVDAVATWSISPPTDNSNSDTKEKESDSGVDNGVNNGDKEEGGKAEEEEKGSWEKRLEEEDVKAFLLY